MILGEDNRKAWSDLDVLVMQAYQIHEDERCQQCGRPRWLCHNDDRTLMVRVRTDECEATKVLKDHDESTKGDRAGIISYPEFYDRDDAYASPGSLVKYRQGYYEQLAEEAKERLDGQD